MPLLAASLQDASFQDASLSLSLSPALFSTYQSGTPGSPLLAVTLFPNGYADACSNLYTTPDRSTFAGVLLVEDNPDVTTVERLQVELFVPSSEPSSTTTVSLSYGISSILPNT